MKYTHLKQRLQEIENGRFKKIIDALEIKDACERCYFFNYKVGKDYSFRCRIGCLGDIISERLKSYFLWKLGIITEKEYFENL